jgi:hypothetical protein
MARRAPAVALGLLAAALVGGCGGDDTIVRPRAPRVFHATPDGAGADCATPQGCLDQAAAGDTVELGAGTYDGVADTLLAAPGSGNFVTNFVAKEGVVVRGQAGREVRIDGQWDPGRVGILVPEGIENFTLENIRFDNCDPGVYMIGGHLQIRQCTFVTGGHGLVAVGTDVDVSDCRFEEYMNEAIVLRNCSGLIARSSFKGDGSFFFTGGSRNLLLEDLLMAFACFGGVRIEDGGNVLARRITIVMAGMVPDADSTAITVAGEAHLTLEKAVIAENRGFGIHCRTGGQVTVTCSDLFNNSSGNYFGCPDATGQDGNLAVDPRFCSIPDSDFHLGPTSPARSAACGAMGAFGDAACVLRGGASRFAFAGGAHVEDHPE